MRKGIDDNKMPPASSKTSKSGRRRLSENATSGLARLSRACDACSARKVKCDEQGPPCHSCSDLNIPCTFLRPSRRRGPPNRYAEAVKSRRRQQGALHQLKESSVLTPLSNIDPWRTDLDSSSAALSAESILPFPTVCLLIDDYFTYIHPLVPIPHEPSFRVALNRRDDRISATFLALVSAMISALVASFPRKPREILKNRGEEALYPNSLSLIDKCHTVCVTSRGTGYLDKDPEIYDPAISYLLGLTAGYTFNFRRCRLYFAECLTLLRLSKVLNLESGNEEISNAEQASEIPYDSESPNPEISSKPNYISQEIYSRLFAVMIAGSRTMGQIGTPISELTITPTSPSYQYPPLPAEIDDQYITANSLGPQPEHKLSKITGFNRNVALFTSYDPLIADEIVHGTNQLYDWEKQSTLLFRSLQNVKRLVDDMPEQLTLKAVNRSGMPQAGLFNFDLNAEPDHAEIAFEIQKANLSATQLGTRSYLVEKYWCLYEIWSCSDSNSQPKPLISEQKFSSANSVNVADSLAASERHQYMTVERDVIIKDLLHALRSIKQINLEPNSASLINKVRLVASTLLNISKTSKSEVALHAEEYLEQFISTLMKLERLKIGDSESGEDDQEAELRNWADLRNHQIRFVRNGGVLSAI